MKKIISFVLLVGIIVFYACGPNKQEIQMREKAKQDSIRIGDSLITAIAQKAQRVQDSTTRVSVALKEKAKQDSIAKSEEQHHKKEAIKKGKLASK